jgi:predicted ATPase/DNA-binding NarL/FixJ family response regulator
MAARRASGVSSNPDAATYLQRLPDRRRRDLLWWSRDAPPGAARPDVHVSSRATLPVRLAGPSLVGAVAGASSSIGRLRGELSGFVGRRSELAAIRVALGGARLVTLCGPGGIGKTRLAVRAAWEARRAFGDGVWLVELASLRDPALLSAEVARGVGLLDQSAGWAVATLSEHLAGQQALLVLDNCEHLLDACAVLAGAVLRACPGLRILATSRQALGVTGEVTFAVPPMSVPDRGDLRPPEKLLQFEAVRLFAERGAAVLPGFRIDAANSQAVAELCARLEGIPLAIELAAVRLRALSPEQILARLADRFALLSAGDPADPRHRTLQVTLDWSYDLLPPPEQAMWQRASVFAGSFDLNAAEAVCAGDGVAAEAILDLVDQLVAKSILRRSPGGDPARYRMLDTVREYGQQRLRETGGAQALALQHRGFYARLAARPDALGPRQLEWIDALDADHENLRAALEYGLSETTEAAAGLAMACDLWLYWETRGHLTEGRRHMDALLAQVQSPCALRTRGLWAAGYLALIQGQVLAAGRLLDEALRAAQGQGDAEAIAYASQFLGRAVWFHGDQARGLALTADALARHRAAGDWQGVVLTLVQLGVMRAFMGDPAAAVRLFQECIGACEERGERWNRSYALWGLGLATWLLGDTERAGELERAALRIKREIGDQIGAALCIEALAWIAASQRHPARAVILLGAAASAREAIPATLAGPLSAYHETTVQDCRRVLGRDLFAASLAKGSALSPSRRVAAALEEPATAGPAAGVQDPGIRLTAREMEVAALVAEGLSNKEIAARMVISPRTAETHVQHIMDKLGFTARSQIAAWSASRRTPRPARAPDKDT